MGPMASMRFHCLNECGHEFVVGGEFSDLVQFSKVLLEVTCSDGLHQLDRVLYSVLRVVWSRWPFRHKAGP